MGQKRVNSFFLSCLRKQLKKMETSQNSPSQKIPFIDFVPAEVKETTGEIGV
jgi:hypothetical protein